MFVGPANMGLCRGLNLLLGMTAAPGVVAGHWPLGLIALTYIAAVTALSRGEVSGGKRPVAVVAFTLLLIVLGALKFVVLAPRVSGMAGAGMGGLGAISIEIDPFALALLAWLAWRVLPPFWRAIGNPDPMVIRAAVRTGVLSLVLLDAVLAAAYAGMIYSLAVLSIWVVAGWLGRRFAVT
jgi:4-hydroxybenzoate polyprenyltransferase